MLSKGITLNRLNLIGILISFKNILSYFIISINTFFFKKTDFFKSANFIIIN
jgi:hypothetical protein